MSSKEPFLSPDDRLVRAAEFYFYLGISKAHFYNLVKKGKIPQPRKLSPRTSLWTMRQVKEALNNMSTGVSG